MELKTDAKVAIFSRSEKKVRNGFIDECNRFTLFLRGRLKDAFLRKDPRLSAAPEHKCEHLCIRFAR